MGRDGKIGRKEKIFYGRNDFPTLQPDVFKDLQDFLKINNNKGSGLGRNSSETITLINQLSTVDIAYGYSMTGFRVKGESGRT